MATPPYSRSPLIQQRAVRPEAARQARGCVTALVADGKADIDPPQISHEVRDTSGYSRRVVRTICMRIQTSERTAGESTPLPVDPPRIHSSRASNPAWSECRVARRTGSQSIGTGPAWLQPSASSSGSCSARTPGTSKRVYPCAPEVRMGLSCPRHTDQRTAARIGAEAGSLPQCRRGTKARPPVG